jgi:hypothetical protein
MGMLDSYHRYRDDVVCRVLDKESVLLDLSSGSYFTLNEVGALVWQNLDGLSPLRSVIPKLMALYDVDPETAEQDVLELVEDLLRERLIEQQETPFLDADGAVSEP